MEIKPYMIYNKGPRRDALDILYDCKDNNKKLPREVLLTILQTHYEDVSNRGDVEDAFITYLNDPEITKYISTIKIHKL